MTRFSPRQQQQLSQTNVILKPSIILSPSASAAAFFSDGKLNFLVIKSLLRSKPRSYVKSLIDGVSGASYSSFRIYEDAADDYAIAKAGGYVRVVRNPGDELKYGPLSMAIM